MSTAERVETLAGALETSLSDFGSDNPEKAIPSSGKQLETRQSSLEVGRKLGVETHPRFGSGVGKT